MGARPPKDFNTPRFRPRAQRPAPIVHTTSFTTPLPAVRGGAYRCPPPEGSSSASSPTTFNTHRNALGVTSDMGASPPSAGRCSSLRLHPQVAQGPSRSRWKAPPLRHHHCYLLVCRKSSRVSRNVQSGGQKKTLALIKADGAVSECATTNRVPATGHPRGDRVQESDLTGR